MLGDHGDNGRVDEVRPAATQRSEVQRLRPTERMRTSAAPALSESRILLVALAAVTLTLFDAAATYVWLSHGIALEANPFIAALMDLIGRSTALLVRAAFGIALVAGLTFLVGRSRLARPALYLVATSLGLVGVWHLQGVSLILSL